MSVDGPELESTSHGVAIYPPGATFGPRQLRDFELVWIIAGQVEYRWGDQVVAAPEGSMVLCRPGVTDFFRWDPRRRTKHAFVHFNISRVPAHWPSSDAWPLVRVMPDGDVVRPVFRHVLTWARLGERHMVRLGVAHMLAAYVTGHLGTQEISADVLPGPVEQAVDYVYERLERDASQAIGFAQLVRVAHVSGPHLCRMFQRTLGCSPMTAVRLARLDRSLVMLARSNYSVKEISGLCGFATPFHFSRAFKQAYGRSPAQLRADMAAGLTPPTSKLMRSDRA